MKNKGFTLIEFLIVIGVVATLSVVAVLVINPTEFIKQARDSRRLTEMKNLNSALSIAEVNNLSLGSSSVVYVSLPDTSPTCNNLGLPSLSSSWSYGCQTSANYRKVDGNGWVPVNFTQIYSGSPLPVLPIDPVNTTSTGNYYTYMTGGGWELTALLKSKKYAKNMIKDGGFDPDIYEVGTNLKLANFARGFIGYWKFDEGSGTTASDSSGNSNTGTLTNGPIWTSGQVNGALTFDGLDDYVNIANESVFDFDQTTFTIAAWVKTTVGGVIISKGAGTSDNSGWLVQHSIGPIFNHPGSIGIVFKSPGGTNQYILVTDSASFGDDNWHYVVAVMTFDTITASNNTASIYVDGVLQAADPLSGAGGTPALNNLTVKIGVRSKSDGTVQSAFNGLIDEVRIYNRALSAAEIAAIYNATK